MGLWRFRKIKLGYTLNANPSSGQTVEIIQGSHITFESFELKPQVVKIIYLGLDF